MSIRSKSLANRLPVSRIANTKDESALVRCIGQPLQLLVISVLTYFHLFFFLKVVLCMIKFLPLDIFGVSHRIPWKNQNAVYRLQISALVPKIFKFEKCVKYANEMTDDVIHLTQYYLKYLKRAILANLQCRPLKLSRLIVL